MSRRTFLYSLRLGLYVPPLSLTPAKAEVNQREPCVFAKQKSSWWAWEDLNFRPHAYQARALTN